ncbi:hypothetical protein KR018_001472 [Drosophila ironensis]|nr:hypothetical protein KR018_001472 [Drosophila ironensis]
MESINEIINRQAFSSEMVDDATEFITVGHSQETPNHRQFQHHLQGCTNVSTMQSLLASSRTEVLNSQKKSASASSSGTDSIVMVIDELRHHNEQEAYQDDPQLHPTILPLEIQQSRPHQQCQNRLVNSSPVDFVASDISLDGLTVDTISQAVLPQGVTIKREHKLVIVDTRGQERLRRLNMQGDSANIGLGVDANEMEDMSSDGGGCDDEEVTLNQHHQQLLEQQQQQYVLSNHDSHQLSDSEAHSSLHHRSSHLDLTLEVVSGEVLSVIVQSQESDKDGDIEDDEDRDSGEREQLLSPVLDHSSYQALTSVNDRMSPPGFSPTSYATLTPIQPLPPISTMSEKFAYSGHISGGDNGGNINRGEGIEVIDASEENNISGDPAVTSASENVTSACGNDCSSFSSLSIPMGSGHLGLNVLSGVQSPYSSYEKLSSMISSPHHNYPESPSNGLSDMVVSCDLHHNSSGRVSLSPQSNTSRVQLCVNGHKKNAAHVQGHEHGLVTLQKQVICLSPSGVVGDTVVVSDYESSYTRHHQHELVMTTPSSTGSTTALQHSPTLSPHSVSAGSAVSMPLHSPSSIINLPNINSSISSLSVDLPVVVSLTPTPPPITNETATVHIMSERSSPVPKPSYFITKSQEINGFADHSNPQDHGISHLSGANHQQLNSTLINEFQEVQQQAKMNASGSPKTTGGGSSRSAGSSDIEEINTKDLAQRISAELKRYSIPQAIFAQRVLCRSQGTLSDLLRNPKPWSKLKSGRETFRRMYKWLQEPEFQRMSALRMAAAQIPQRTHVTSGTTISGSSASIVIPDSQAGPSVSPSALLSGSLSATSGHGSSITVASINCRRKEEPHIEQMHQPKKPRLVFTDLQRRTLQAIFKETKRPSKEMQVTIARQLGLEPTTVGNFFMNARRRSMDKWRDDDAKSITQSIQNRQQEQDRKDENNRQSNSQTQDLSHASNHTRNNSLTNETFSSLHTTAMSPIGNFDDESDMDLELDSNDFDLDSTDRDML